MGLYDTSNHEVPQDFELYEHYEITTSSWSGLNWEGEVLT